MKILPFGTTSWALGSNRVFQLRTIIIIIYMCYSILTYKYSSGTSYYCILTARALGVSSKDDLFCADAFN